MNTSRRVHAIGRGLIYIGLLLLALRLAKYLINEVTLWAGYIGGIFFVAGIFVWFIGTVMVGYTEQHRNISQP